MLLDMALVRAIDALDLYIRASRRNPTLVQDDGLRNVIDAAGRSILKSFGQWNRTMGIKTRCFRDGIRYDRVAKPERARRSRYGG